MREKRRRREYEKGRKIKINNYKMEIIYFD